MADGTPRITNADLAVMLGRMDTRMTVIESTVGRLAKLLEGNGKPGLLEDYRCLESKVTKHLDEYSASKEATKEKRNKWDGRAWAVLLLIIGQIVTWAFIVIRTGA